MNDWSYNLNILIYRKTCTCRDEFTDDNIFFKTNESIFFAFDGKEVLRIDRTLGKLVTGLNLLTVTDFESGTVRNFYSVRFFFINFSEFKFIPITIISYSVEPMPINKSGPLMN